MGQVNHDALYPDAYRLRYIGQSRWRIVAAQYNYAGQRLKGPIIALGVDHAYREALENDLFTGQASDPGLSGSRVPGQKDVATYEMKGEWGAIVERAQCKNIAARYVPEAASILRSFDVSTLRLLRSVPLK